MARGERGHVLVMLTISLVMLFGMMGLAVDLGWSYYRKQAAQAAAEAAAIAAANWAISSSSVTCGGTVNGRTVTCNSTAVNCPATASTNLNAGCLYATSNGFSNSGNQTSTIAGNTTAPSTASGITSQLYWATSTITENNPQLFSGMLGNHTYGKIIAQATAGVFTAAVPNCLYVLDKTANSAGMVSGSNSFIYTGCGMYVDSSSATALTVNGQGRITAPVINVVGNYSSCSNGNDCFFNPSLPKTGQAYMADPLKTLAAPTYSGCGQSSSNLNLNQGSYTIQPGVYCGGITVSGNANVTFSPGLYILNGGGLNVNSANASVYGNGVTFFNTANGYSYGPILITGQATISLLKAQTTGTYAGVLFYQDRNITSTTANQINGNTNPNLSGDLYFPTTPLLLTGGSSATPIQGRIIADTFTANGGGVYISLSGPATCCGTGTITALIQ